MKLQAELTYTLTDEPAEFKDLPDASTRKVYLWLRNRGYLEKSGPWAVYNRASEMIDEPVNGFLEFWTCSKEEISPPNIIDDMWCETYKLIVKNKVSVEWHPKIHQLRFIWLQSPETLNEKKLLSTVLDEIMKFNLPPPAFPALCP